MMTVPWRTTADAALATTAVAQVSRLELRRARDIPAFLLTALRLRRAVLRTPGALGVSLRAQPSRRTFWTLSSWRDTDAIAAFTRSPEHVEVMRAFRDRMRGSHFHTWWLAEGAGAPDWADALDRLDETASTRGVSTRSAARAIDGASGRLDR